MREYSKAIKRQLNELNGLAHEAALRKALEPLARDFAAWQRGELGTFELKEKIHQFDHGPARKLYSQYDLPGIIEVNVAAAIVDGLLDRAKISPELLAAIGDIIDMVRRNREDHEAGPAEHPAI